MSRSIFLHHKNRIYVKNDIDIKPVDYWSVLEPQIVKKSVERFNLQTF